MELSGVLTLLCIVELSLPLDHCSMLALSPSMVHSALMELSLPAGSLNDLGTLSIYGSLKRAGTHEHCGSLPNLGALNLVGSLIVSEAL